MSVEFQSSCKVLATGDYIPVTMQYDKEDPASVRFTFYNLVDNSAPVWIFARDLLKDVLDNGDSGDGDITFVLDGGMVIVTLESNDGRSRAAFEEGLIHEFVESVYEEVPEGKDEYEVPDGIPDEWLV